MISLRSDLVPPTMRWGALARSFQFLFATFSLVAVLMAGALSAQAQTVIPDDTTKARLVWSTMVTLDNANRTNDYAMLHHLGSPEFQEANSPQDLSNVFASLRRDRVDVGRAILVAPTYYLTPAINTDGELRLRGGFEYRPKSLRFDILFRNIDGGWRIHALSLAEMDAAAPK